MAQAVRIGGALDLDHLGAEIGEQAAQFPAGDDHAQIEDPQSLSPQSPHRKALLGWAAQYLGKETKDGKPLDAVARFHLGNGARVERINWLGDPSTKGIKQSYGLMVNYLYDLKRLDKHRTMLAQGQIPISGAIEDLYL